MTTRNRTMKALSALLPAGILGVSVTLALTPADASMARKQPVGTETTVQESVADRLQAIRDGVSMMTDDAAERDDAGAGENPNIIKAWWANGGWGRPGWRNGGWGNGGWGRPAWGNGGWRNGGWFNGGWRNGGWPNFWRNW